MLLPEYETCEVGLSHRAGCKTPRTYQRGSLLDKRYVMSAARGDNRRLAACDAPAHHKDFLRSLDVFPHVFILHARHGIKCAMHKAALAVLAYAALQAGDAVADFIRATLGVLSRGIGIGQGSPSHRDHVGATLLKHGFGYLEAVNPAYCDYRHRDNFSNGRRITRIGRFGGAK